MSESTLLRAVLDYLAASGIARWRLNVTGVPIPSKPGMFRPAPSRGICDVLAVRDGLAIGIECKSATGRQSPAQREFELRWEQAGGLYVLARSVEELREALRDAGVEMG